MLWVIILLDPFLLGTTPFCWSIWLIRNEEVLDKCRPKSLLQVLFRGTHWLRFWAQLQRCEVQQSIIVEACRKPENATMRLFASFGWLVFSIIGFWVILVENSFQVFCVLRCNKFSLNPLVGGWSQIFLSLSKKSWLEATSQWSIAPHLFELIKRRNETMEQELL